MVGGAGTCKGDRKRAISRKLETSVNDTPHSLGGVPPLFGALAAHLVLARSMQNGDANIAVLKINRKGLDDGLMGRSVTKQKLTTTHTQLVGLRNTH